MTRKRSEKEMQFLRETNNGQTPHYFNPTSPQVAQQLRQRRSAKQVEDMRRAAGIKEPAK